MRETSSDFDIVILGHVAKDINEFRNDKEEAIGGVVYYGGMAGSHMGLKIAIITRLRREDFHLLEEFKNNGIQYFVYPSKETSGIRNVYRSERMEFRDCQILGFAGKFKKKEIPILNTKFFVIGSIMAGEVDYRLLKYLYKIYPGKLCLDIQGFLRKRKKGTIYYTRLNEHQKRAILKRIDYLKIDHNEAELLTKENDIIKAAENLIKMGPKEILITHEKGIMLKTKTEFYSLPWRNDSLKGRTGRGDTAFISYLGSRIKLSPKESLKFAAALTSLKMETPGAFNLPLNLVQELIKREYENII